LVIILLLLLGGGDQHKVTSLGERSIEGGPSCILHQSTVMNDCTLMEILIVLSFFTYSNDLERVEIIQIMPPFLIHKGKMNKKDY
jgi:hypothetical protein